MGTARSFLRRDAEPLAPKELITIRKLLRRVPLDEYLDSAEVASRLGLHKRTVLDLAHKGAFDGSWGSAFKPAYNRLRIPVQGVQAYIEKHAAHQEEAA